MNDIPNEFKLSTNKNISGNKSKPIPVTSENVRKGKKSQSVHAAGLSCLWDIGAPHCLINKYYIKKYQEDFSTGSSPRFPLISYYQVHIILVYTDGGDRGG